MAVSLLLIKDRDDAQSVRYRFGPDEQHLGLLQLDKQTGDVHELTGAPHPHPQEIFFPSAVKVREHWRSGNYPDRTAWTAPQ